MKEDNSRVTVKEVAMGAMAVASVAVGLWLAGLVAGCANTPSGVKVVASSATYTNVGDINWDEYKIPVLSVYLGPKAIVWVNKDYTALKGIEVTGCVTNDTAALGIYDSKEMKTLGIRAEFGEPKVSSLKAEDIEAGTNAVETVEKGE